MAHNLLWVRDSFLTTADVAHDDGTYYVDLLWKARTGRPHVADPGIQDTFPTVTEESLQLRAGRRDWWRPDVEQRSLEARGDLPAPGELPTFDLNGAYVKRIILKYLVYFAAIPGELPSEHSRFTDRGTWEGITHGVSENLPYGKTGDWRNPWSTSYMQSTDWIWWDRAYAQQNSVHSYNLGTSLLSEIGMARSIDTRNGRTLYDWGETLYLCVAPSKGLTANGLAASWSVLLDLPG